MAGNAVVWKPSELATGVAVATRERLLAAGVPPDVLALLAGGPTVARALCGDERVAAVHFTGSEAAGREIAGLVAPRLGRCALELSGINSAIVFADADLDHAADCIVACATSLAGQKCTATRRVLVAEAVRDPLVERLAARLAALRPGDPRARDTSIGPLISPAAEAQVEDAVAAAVGRGARLLARSPQGAPGPGGARAARAALVDGLGPGDPLRARELFGPVIALQAFAEPDEAWHEADASPYGLSAAVYSRDPALLAAAPARLRAGVVALNRRGDDVELEAPFGGHKRSGNGQAEGGEWVYGALTDTQAVYGAVA
jgi:aldehyde dehydrogenase (NAD+)